MNYKITLILLGLFICLFALSSCKTKKETVLENTDPTKLEVVMLLECKKEVSEKEIAALLKEYEITQLSRSSRSAFQYQCKILLQGQSAQEALNAIRSLDFVNTAKLMEGGQNDVENLEISKSTKTKPIKGE